MHRTSGAHGPNYANRAAIDRAHHRARADNLELLRSMPAGTRILPGRNFLLIQCEQCGRCRLCLCFCWPVGWA